MTQATQKAILTRTRRLSEAFLAEYGRRPTVDEINDLYSAEMRAIAEKSSRNKEGRGGFAATKQQDPELLKQWQDKGRANRVKKT